jgi:hypothetical protein
MTESAERLEREREEFRAWARDNAAYVFDKDEEARLAYATALLAWQAARRAPAEVGALDYPAHPFAIVVDRTYESEGQALAVWNGENYSFSDGDCYEREPDGTLDGFDVEWLTHHQLEQRLLAAAPLPKQENE